MEHGKPVCSVLFDVRKAFDSVPHSSLIEKLQMYGLNTYLLRWICDYLSGREQRVLLNGTTSRPQHALSGVPQGSVLGSILFTLYINELADLQLTEGSKVVAYADDLLLYKSIESTTDYARIQEDITAIRNWMSYNFLTLNASKCKYMLVSRSRIYQHPQLYLADQPLECVQSYKYLGVTITSTLSWSDHIQLICNKSRRLVGLLYRQFYLNADSDTLRQFYLSCIRPHLEYACSVWDPYLSKERSLLEDVQTFACKVCCKNWHMGYESMLTHLNIPSLQQRRLQLKANMMHQFVHGTSYVPDGTLHPHPPARYDTQTCFYFSVPFARTNAYYHSFFPHVSFLE